MGATDWREGNSGRMDHLGACLLSQLSQLWKSYSERLQDAQTVAHWPTASCLDPDSFLELGSQIRLRERRETQGEEEEEEEDGIQMGVGEGSCSREGPS